MEREPQISSVKILRSGCNTELEVNFECEQHGGNCCQNGFCCQRGPSNGI